MIRKATADDLGQLVCLYKELYSYHNEIDPKTYKTLSDELCESKVKAFFDLDIFEIICHETDGVIDAFVSYIAMHSQGTAEKPSGALMVNDFIVAEKARHQGIGTELFNELLKIAEEKFFETITLDVHLGNTNARAFYEKMGFEPTTVKMKRRI